MAWRRQRLHPGFCAVPRHTCLFPKQMALAGFPLPAGWPEKPLWGLPSAYSFFQESKSCTACSTPDRQLLFYVFYPGLQLFKEGGESRSCYSIVTRSKYRKEASNLRVWRCPSEYLLGMQILNLSPKA